MNKIYGRLGLMAVSAVAMMGIASCGDDREDELEEAEDSYELMAHNYEGPSDDGETLTDGEQMANSVYEFSANSLGGEPVQLNEYKGKVLLIVNTASECGFTPQYEGLEKLYEEYKDKGFVVLGFPCNQFGGQEPGSSEEIANFCEMNYGVSFPLFEKVDVNGENEHPLYTYLKSEQSGMVTDAIKWNFTKFLVDKNGKPVDRYAPQTKPADIKGDIEKLL
jgi:glutathione peroxidase